MNKKTSQTPLKTSSSNKLNNRKQLTRLPCRGCTYNCRYYNSCDGKLWRMNDNTSLNSDNFMLTIFYDSQCPLCMKEMIQLKNLDKQKRINFADLHAENFNHIYPYIDQSKANNILHGELPSGEIILGLDVTCKAWTLVGKHKWLVILRWPVIRYFADITYRVFARYRSSISYLLTGNTTCKQCTLDKL